jgi:hypothetical protein
MFEKKEKQPWVIKVEKKIKAVKSRRRNPSIV